MRAVLRTLFLSDFFRSETAYFAKVKSPVEHVIGTMRLVKDFTFPKLGLREIALECRYMGQDLLNPPSVEGWHTGKEWIDTGCLVERINFAAQQVKDLTKPGCASSSTDSAPPARFRRRVLSTCVSISSGRCPFLRKRAMRCSTTPAWVVSYALAPPTRSAPPHSASASCCNSSWRLGNIS